MMVMRFRTALKRSRHSLGLCAAGTIAAFLVTAPPAIADPDDPVPPPPPPSDIMVQADGADPVPPPAPASDIIVQTDAADPATPPVVVQHLSSPDNLPPGTSNDPVGPPQGEGLSYLRELWHAIRTQDVNAGDALLLLTQRPMNANSAPPPGMAAGPQEPLPAEPPPPAPPTP